ncbi:MAG TPA: MEDS domain-containing protein [Candidatus Kapabacteria bacterium]|jgi:hypothetical protein
MNQLMDMTSGSSREQLSTTALVSPDIFWAEISPCEHMVQLYENEEAFLMPLAAFVTGGLRSGEAVIVIATVSHLASLEAHLLLEGLDLESARRAKQYFALEAEGLLGRFMVDGWPDESLFRETILTVLQQARLKFPRVRAFGEMVALLWAQGFSAATVRLEYLWHQLYKPESISLLCSYPRTGFTSTPQDSIEEIYRNHSKVLQSH